MIAAVNASRRMLWVAGLAALILLLWRTMAVPLIDPDETRYARTSHEMLEAGELVVPTFEGRPRLVKPPLFHWLQMYSFRMLGESRFTARLPSVLATLGSLWLLAWVARRRFGDEGAAWAAVFFVTMPLVVIIGRLGILDALLSLHVLAVIAVDIAEPKETGGYRGMAIGALLGLGFLAKGPIGIILPLLMILAGRSASGRNVIPGRSAALGCLSVFVVVVGPWSLAFLGRIGGGSSWAVIREEVLARFFQGTEHIEGPSFFFKVMAVGFFPWVVPLIAAIVRCFNRRRDPAARTAVYASAALFASLVFLSLGQGKLPTYILPLAPLVALLTTWELGQELRAPRERTFVPLVLAVSLGVFSLILMAASAVWDEPSVPTTALAGALIFLVGCGVALLGVLRRRPRVVFGTAAISSFLFMLVIMQVMYPGMMTRRSILPLIEKAPVMASLERPLVLVGMERPGIAWYLDRVPEKISREALAERVDRGDRPLILIDQRDEGKLHPDLRRRLQSIAEYGKFQLLEPVESGAP